MTAPTDTAPSTYDGYEIVQADIASGGSGVIHKARDADGRLVAIKVLDREKFAKRIAEDMRYSGKSPTEIDAYIQEKFERQVFRFKEEYNVLVGLKHANLARVDRIGLCDGQYYMVSEFIEGQQIAAYLRGRKPVDMIPLFIQGLSGLDFIHRNGILHLDIKSENILVFEEDGEPKVKIIDFGLAMAPSEYDGAFCGTYTNIAPEVALGLKDKVDARADLFSFGVVMYQCITWCHYPYPRTKMKKLDVLKRIIENERLYQTAAKAHASNPGFVPDYLDTIVTRLLAKEPENRFYTNARAVINALATHLPDAFEDSLDTLGAYLRPEHNAYIGRDEALSEVLLNVDALMEGKEPETPVYRVIGGQGLGKTHFLSCLKENVEKRIEDVAVHAFSLPADEDALERRVAALSKQLADNTKPMLVLVDNFHELTRTGGMAQSAASTISGLVRHIHERHRSGKIYEDVKPAMLVFTADLEAEADDDVTLTLANLLSDEDVGAEAVSKTIELKPFSNADVRTYLQATPAFHGKDLPDERVEALLRRTAGIPRELVDTLQQLDSSNLLFDAGGEIMLPELGRLPEEPTRLPASTHDRLLAQYERLGPLERKAAEVLTCWRHKPFLPKPDSNDLASFDGQFISLQALHAITQKGIALHDPATDAYTFVESDYMPGLIHARMDENLRARIHSSIAECLERKSADRYVRAISWHLAFGSDKETAIRNAILLGRALLYDEGQCGLAIELCERAKGLLSETRWKLKAYVLAVLTEAYFYHERLNQAWESIQKGLSLVSGKSFHWEVVFKLKQIVCLIQSRQFDESKRAIDELHVALTDKKNTIASLVLLNYEGRYYYESALANPERSSESLATAKELYEKSERLEQSIPSWNRDRIKNNDLYLVLRSLGLYELSAQKAAEQIRLRKYSIFKAITAYAELSEIYRRSGQHDQALEAAQKALSLANRYERGRLLFHIHGTLASIHHDRNEFRQSIEELNRQLAASACIADQDEFKRLCGRLWTYLGQCYEELKQWDKAIIYFDSAIASHTDAAYIMAAYQGLGEVYYHKGEYEQAFDSLAKAEALLENMASNAVMNSYRFRISKLKADVYIQKGEKENARQLLRQLTELAGEDPERINECAELEQRLNGLS